MSITSETPSLIETIPPTNVVFKILNDGQIRLFSFPSAASAPDWEGDLITLSTSSELQELWPNSPTSSHSFLFQIQLSFTPEPAPSVSLDTVKRLGEKLSKVDPQETRKPELPYAETEVPSAIGHESFSYSVSTTFPLSTSAEYRILDYLAVWSESEGNVSAKNLAIDILEAGLLRFSQTSSQKGPPIRVEPSPAKTVHFAPEEIGYPLEYKPSSSSHKSGPPANTWANPTVGEWINIVPKPCQPPQYTTFVSAAQTAGLGSRGALPHQPNRPAELPPSSHRNPNLSSINHNVMNYGDTNRHSTIIPAGYSSHSVRGPRPATIPVEPRQLYRDDFSVGLGW
ncbi:hypothetical protein T439DRAFT_381387 [Meredithblackwellia eburnea MCA 4105]